MGLFSIRLGNENNVYFSNRKLNEFSYKMNRDIYRGACILRIKTHAIEKHENTIATLISTTLNSKNPRKAPRGRKHSTTAKHPSARRRFQLPPCGSPKKVMGWHRAGATIAVDLGGRRPRSLEGPRPWGPAEVAREQGKAMPVWPTNPETNAVLGCLDGTCWIRWCIGRSPKLWPPRICRRWYWLTRRSHSVYRGGLVFVLILCVFRFILESGIY